MARISGWLAQIGLMFAYMTPISSNAAESQS